MLFVPQIRSNLDCVLCLDCARACPYDNVALGWRGVGHEVTNPTSWPVDPATGFLPFFLTAAALANAFGMVPPAYTLGEGTRIFVLLVFLTLVLPWLAMRFLGWWHARYLGHTHPWHRTVARLSTALIPLSFGIWAAHYGFHFLSTAWVAANMVVSYSSGDRTFGIRDDPLGASGTSPTRLSQQTYRRSALPVGAPGHGSSLGCHCPFCLAHGNARGTCGTLKSVLALHTHKGGHP